MQLARINDLNRVYRDLQRQLVFKGSVTAFADTSLDLEPLKRHLNMHYDDSFDWVSETANAKSIYEWMKFGIVHHKTPIHAQLLDHSFVQGLLPLSIIRLHTSNPF